MPVLGLKLRISNITAKIASVYQTGLQMWLKMQDYLTEDGSTDRLPDSSSGGTNTGALYTGRGLSFDGINDKITFTDNNTLSFGNGTTDSAFSISFYIKSQASTSDGIISKATSATVGEYYVFLSTTNDLYFRLVDNSTSAYIGKYANIGVNDTFHHVVCTYDGLSSESGLNIYINGVIGSMTSSSSGSYTAMENTALDLEFGNRGGSLFFNGDLSNVKIFDIELSSAQVTELYANPELVVPTGATFANLVGWWPLTDGEVGSTPPIVLDASGNNNHGTPAGVTQIGALPQPTTQWALKGHNAPMLFDGSNDYISGTADAAGTKLSFYVKLISNTLDSTYRHVFGIGTGGGGSEFGLYRVASTAGAPAGKYAFHDGGVTIYPETSNRGDAEYAEIVVTVNGTSAKIYINGSLDNSHTVASTNVTTLTYSVGRDHLFSSFSKDIILECALWNEDLNSTNVSDLYGGTLPTSIQSANLQFWYKNTGNTNADWIDLSGNGNDGTVNGSPTTMYIPEGNTSGQDILSATITNTSSGGLVLDNEGYALVADDASLDITDELTLEAWVYPFSVSAAQTIIGKASAYQLEITSGAKPSFSKWTTTETATATTSTTVSADTWTHLAATYDGVNVRLYVNGALDTTTPVTGAIDTNSNDVLIGAISAGSEEFDGKIDEARIYSGTVLTDAQIAGNYNASKGSHQ